MTPHTQPISSRFALRPRSDRTVPFGAWWPSTRTLADELSGLFEQWPPDRGRIRRVLYSPPDWDDHPRWVQVPGRRIKTGSFPRDDTHQLTITLFNGDRHALLVIPPGTPTAEAGAILAGLGQPDPGPAGPGGDVAHEGAGA